MNVYYNLLYMHTHTHTCTHTHTHTHTHSHTIHRLSVEARVSEETSLLEGQLEGVEVTDLTEIGRKYREILTMGGGASELGEGVRREGVSREGEVREGEVMREGVRRDGVRRDGVMRKEGEVREGVRSDSDMVTQFLRFSVHITPHPPTLTSLPHSSNDVHLSLSVPSIHYTHSVNLVREMERFVSEFQELSRAVMTSFSSAAVGVAKGLVNEKSQFAETLSTSLGPRSIHPTPFHPSGGPEIRPTDDPLEVAPRDHLYVEVLVQSPVITLPSSLHGEKCLVAYLGEISVMNEFTSENMADSLSVSISPYEREIVTIRIDRMSLHATHDSRSRELLVSSGGRRSEGRWWKVLDETSIVTKIDRRIGGEGERGHVGGEEEEEEEEEEGEVVKRSKVDGVAKRSGRIGGEGERAFIGEDDREHETKGNRVHFEEELAKRKRSKREEIGRVDFEDEVAAKRSRVECETESEMEEEGMSEEDEEREGEEGATPTELRGGVFSNKLDIISPSPSLSLARSSHFFCTHLAPAQWEAARGFKCRPLTPGLTFDLNRLCGCISSETIDCTRFFLRPYSVASWSLFHCLTEYL